VRHLGKISETGAFPDTTGAEGHPFDLSGETFRDGISLDRLVLPGTVAE
jgi:hypothetical protein